MLAMARLASSSREVLHQEGAGLLHFHQEQRLVVLLGRDGDGQHHFAHVALDGGAGGGQVEVDLRLPVAFARADPAALRRSSPSGKRPAGPGSAACRRRCSARRCFVGHGHQPLSLNSLVVCVQALRAAASSGSSSPRRSSALVSSKPPRWRSPTKICGTDVRPGAAAFRRARRPPPRYRSRCTQRPCHQTAGGHARSTDTRRWCTSRRWRPRQSCSARSAAGRRRATWPVRRAG